jgi:hypothetical protein
MLFPSDRQEQSENLAEIDYAQFITAHRAELFGT